MRTSRLIYLAVIVAGLIAVITLPDWMAGRSTPELGGVVVIPAAPASPSPPPRITSSMPGDGAVQVLPRPPLGAVHDDDSDHDHPEDDPEDDPDTGDHGRHLHGH